MHPTPEDAPTRTTRAVRAASEAARALGLDVHEPVVLHDVFSVVVHLAPAPVVARVPTLAAPSQDRAYQLRRQARELDVVAWLDARGVPVSRPSPLVARAPVEREGFAMTFWELVDTAPDHAPYAGVDIERVAELHAALRDYPGDLVFLAPIARSVGPGLAALEGRPALLAAADLERARREWEVIGPLLSSREAFERRFPGVSVQPVHGDAPMYNTIRAVDGVRFADFEDVNLGPVECDLVGASPEDLARYDTAAVARGLRPHDPDVLRLLTAGRNLQTLSACALIPQLPPLAGWLAPSVEAWRAGPFAGGLG